MEHKYVSKKRSNLKDEDLRLLSHEELINLVLQLQSHNDQLKNIISKQNAPNEITNSKKKREFDFTKWRKLHILFKILYFGWDYSGYASQEDTNSTIEHHLFGALLKCRLIESRQTSNYHRCGRTDKGVSAFSQVISITVRANDEDKKPLEYCKMLNRLLPEDIRFIAWQPVSEEFSARFNCKSRTYRYFFPKAELNLKSMNESAQFLVGTHDFRNLCKMDVANGVINFTRTVANAKVFPLDSPCSDEGTGYEMCALEITSQAFLWHQIRCIMAVLLLVGKGLEEATIIKDLLDIQDNPRKPQYPMAHDIGLNLFDTEFDCNNDWIYDDAETSYLVEQLQSIWAINAIKATHIRTCLQELERLLTKPILKQSSVLLRQESKVYKSLLRRNLCNSLEDRIDHYVKKRKIEPTNVETLSAD